MVYLNWLKKRAGFTLIELLVVIAIIAILIALLVPAVQKVREAAARISCANQVKQLVLASHNYNDQNKKLPPACSRNPSYGATYAANWHFHILPFVEQSAVFNMCAIPNTNVWDNPVAGTPSGTLRTLTMSLFQCPSDTTLSNGYALNQVNVWAGTSYASNYQVFGTVRTGGADLPQYKLGNIPDGTSNTVFVTERSATCGGNGNLLHWPGGEWDPTQWGVTIANSPWGGNWNQPPQFQPNPYNTVCDRYRPSTWHSGAAVTGMGDGSVRNVSPSVTQNAWQIAVVANDNLPMDPSWNQ